MSEEEYSSLLETLHLIQSTKTKQDIDDSLNNIDNKDFWVDESEVDFEKIWHTPQAKAKRVLGSPRNISNYTSFYTSITLFYNNIET